MNQKQFLQVNGVGVIAQEVARDKMYGPNTAIREIKSVAELLLADGSTVYGCVHPNPAARDCEFTADTVRSVTAHQRSHSFKAKAQKTFENRSRGAKQAAATRKANRAARSTTLTNEPNTQIAANAGNLTADLIAKGLSGLAAELRDVAAEIDRLVRRMPATPTAPLIDANELDRLQEIEKNYIAMRNFLK